MPKDNVYPFRRVKWGDPQQKLKVLAEDIAPRRARSWFPFLVLLTGVAAFCIVALT